MEIEDHSFNGSDRGVGERGRVETSLTNTSSPSDLNHSSSDSNLRQQRHYHHTQEDPMQSWWESVSKARSRIQALLSFLPHSECLSSLADSDCPARSLLDSYDAYSGIASALSGSGDDPICQWLYDTFLQSSGTESDLRLVVLSLVPLIAGLYLSRIHAFSTTSPVALGSPSLAGFEAVLLSFYTFETKSRAGKPLLVSVPSPAYLSRHPSLYHNPSPPQITSHNYPGFSYSPPNGGIGVGILSPPLEPQMGIKSTKRASIVGVAFHCFFKHISQMPPWSKIDLCRFATSWAGDDCPCAQSLDFHSTAAAATTTITNEKDHIDDEDVTNSEALNGNLITQHLHPNKNVAVGREIILSEDVSSLDMNGNCNIQNSYTLSEGEGKGQEHEQGMRIPLPWELLQPLLRILAHCLLAPPPLNTQEIKNVASIAVRRLYARASHDLAPQAIVATQSLVHLDNRARAMAKADALTTASSNATTPKTKKREVLLVSN